MAKIFIQGLLAFFVLFIASGLSHAQNCDAIVVDAAGVFGIGMADVESAAQRLQNLGAEVRVRTFKHGKNLDFIQRDLEKQCVTWQSADGGRKNNLIVMMISIQDRQFGFYAGEQWRSALDTQYTRIENDYMVPRFRDGDFAGGFVAGLDQITQLIDVKINQPVPGSQPSVVVESEPVDLSGLWRVMGWLVGLGALAGLGFLIWQLKLQSERRRAARQKAVVRKQAAATRVNELNVSVGALEAEIETTRKRASDTDSSLLLQSLSETKNLVEGATIKYSDVNKSAGDPSRPKLSQAEYEAIELSYNGVINSLEEARTSLKNTETSLRDLQHLIAEAPRQIQKAGTALENASVKIVDAQKDGFKTEDLDASLSEAREYLKKAENNLEDKNFTTALGNAAEVQKSAASIAQAVRGLSERKNALEDALPRLDSRVRQAAQDVVNGRTVFERISSDYAPSSWQSVQGNGTEAEERVDWARDAVETIRSLSGMANQKWQEAEELLKEVGQRLTEAESFMRSIIALEANLIAAKKDASSEISAARADIKKAWVYINKHDDDIPESFETDLQEAEGILSAAEDELGRDKPDYIEVVKFAQSANSLADSILEKSRTAHEKAERLRQKAESLTRDANGAYSKAKEYIEDHSSDVESPAEESLAQAKKYLETLKRTSATDKQIEVAAKAEKSAQEAYAKAKKDVDDAEEERGRQRIRAAADLSTRAASYSSRSSSSGFSIRSSGGLGSSGGGFGGSRSFGASGRGFGGSRGW